MNIREVQPDVDRMYMTYVQALTGHGGWPMSVFLTPELYPIFGGTYWPAQDQPGFPSILKRISALWKQKPDELRKAGEETIQQLQNLNKSEGGELSKELNVKIANKLYQKYLNLFDESQGGFDDEPKFPTPVNLNFLLRYYYYQMSELDRSYENYPTISINEIKRIGNSLGIDFKDLHNEDEYVNRFKSTVENRKNNAQKALEMVKFTLKLYDQAQLLMSYVDVYLITKDDYYAEVARDIINYVERDLRDSKCGGFYSAEDADSYPYEGAEHKLEGAFAVWEELEIKKLLGEKDSEIFCWHFGVKPNGNVDPEKDIQGELKNKNVLIERYSLEETSKKYDISADELKTILTQSKQKLAKYRFEKRPKPHLDDKIITAWNGLMISGLSKAYDILKVPNFLDLARNSAKFIKENMYDNDKKILLRSFREGPSNVQGFADDYSFFIAALIDLYQSTFDESYLSWAVELQETQNKLFYDKEGGGGFFNVAEGTSDILVRLKEDYDGAEPSANSVAVNNLLRLGNILCNTDYINKAEETLKLFAGRLNNSPHAMPFMMSSLFLYYKGIKQIMVLGAEKNDPQIQKFIQCINNHFVPSKTLLLITKDKNQQEILDLFKFNETIQSFVKSIGENDGNSINSVHICENFTCSMPIDSLDILEESLRI
nr:8160_t:CDS:10 [Entrophospora candida]